MRWWHSSVLGGCFKKDLIVPPKSSGPVLVTSLWFSPFEVLVQDTPPSLMGFVLLCFSSLIRKHPAALGLIWAQGILELAGFSRVPVGFTWSLPSLPGAAERLLMKAAKPVGCLPSSKELQPGITMAGVWRKEKLGFQVLSNQKWKSDQQWQKVAASTALAFALWHLADLFWTPQLSKVRFGKELEGIFPGNPSTVEYLGK